MDKGFKQALVDDYSLILLNWAKGKTSSRELAEELVQVVWLQIFHGIKANEEKGLEIQKPENFIWKIAHYVWCSYLSAKQSPKNSTASIENYYEDSELQLEDFRQNFAEQIVEEEENKRLIAYMRKKVMTLNYLQREILISFYIDGKSQKEIAERLNVPVSTVKWHLFETRNKLRQEIKTMESKNESTQDFTYRPKHLHMAINGDGVPFIDIDKITNNLSKQNICIECYKTPKTLDELNKQLGIPKPYLEEDINWLVNQEFLSEKDGKYYTTFSIHSNQDTQNERKIFLDMRSQISDVIVNDLISAEERIKKIGFYGSDKPMEKLLWSLIYTCASRLDYPYKETMPEYPVRPDGGKYFPLGFDYTDYGNLQVYVDTSNWAENGWMTNCTQKNDMFIWYGLYNFGFSDIIDIAFEEYLPENRNLTKILLDMLDTYDGIDFHYDTKDFTDKQKESLALLIQKGFVHLEETKLYPNFLVFSKEQMDQLQVIFSEINEKLQEPLKVLVSRFVEHHEKNIPAHLKYMKPFFVRQSLVETGAISTVFAFNDKKLYIPEDKAHGEFLTFMFIKNS